MKEFLWIITYWFLQQMITNRQVEIGKSKLFRRDASLISVDSFNIIRSANSKNKILMQVLFLPEEELHIQ